MELKNLKELLQMYKKYTITGMAVFATAAVLTTGCGTTKTGDAAEGTTGATNETTEEDANELIENTHASIERLVTKYLDCIINGDTDTLATITDELTDEDKEILSLSLQNPHLTKQTLRKLISGMGR